MGAFNQAYLLVTELRFYWNKQSPAGNCLVNSIIISWLEDSLQQKSLFKNKGKVSIYRMLGLIVSIYGLFCLWRRKVLSWLIFNDLQLRKILEINFRFYELWGNENTSNPILNLQWTNILSFKYHGVRESVFSESGLNKRQKHKFVILLLAEIF